MTIKLTLEQKREFIKRFYQHYWEEGKSVSEVGKVLGLSYKAVYERAVRLHLPMRTPKQGLLFRFQGIRKKRLLERIAKFPRAKKNRSEAMKKFWKEVKSGKKYKSNNV